MSFRCLQLSIVCITYEGLGLFGLILLIYVCVPLALYPSILPVILSCPFLYVSHIVVISSLVSLILQLYLVVVIFECF